MRKGRLTAKRRRSLVKGICIKFAIFSYIFFLLIAQTMGSTTALFNDTESIGMHLKAADEFPDPFLDEWDKSSIEVTNGNLESCIRITADIKNVGDGNMGGELKYWIYFGNGAPGNNLEENENYEKIYEGKYGPLKSGESEKVTYELDEDPGNGKYFVVAERHPKHANGKGSQNKGLPRAEVNVSCFDDKQTADTDEETTEELEDSTDEEKDQNDKKDNHIEKDEDDENPVEEADPEDQKEEDEADPEAQKEEGGADEHEQDEEKIDVKEKVTFKLNTKEDVLEIEFTNDSSIDLTEVVIVLHSHQGKGAVKNNNAKLDEIKIDTINAGESKALEFDKEFQQFSAIRLTSSSGSEHWSDIYEKK
ncbi:hypothetical protein JSY36_15115 [Bacillus sp. H-16]|uniref:hypothetical protein n=1 Tax=Alteribacter salitolerans TaxID=2912333 RepID=UPI001963D7C5|nr:hypothetical protein [Alteribacter salitolerans]MBM7097061.1 hypothetical protein [Alteribacter salitolerans]